MTTTDPTPADHALHAAGIAARDAATINTTYRMLAADLDGTPPDHVPHDELAHGDDVYMRRYYIARGLTANMRLHHIMRSDAERDLHDHPWNFTTHLLSGGYREHTPHGYHDYWAPAILNRHATDLHRLELLDGPMWTLIITGPWLRPWGFETPTGWVHWRHYHADHGRTHGEGATS